MGTRLRLACAIAAILAVVVVTVSVAETVVFEPPQIADGNVEDVTVGADGDGDLTALVLVGADVLAYERPAGTGTWSAPVTLDTLHDGPRGDVAVNAAGAAVAVWRGAGGQLRASYRAAGGAFKPAEAIPGAPVGGLEQFHAAIEPDGTALVAWHGVDTTANPELHRALVSRREADGSWSAVPAAADSVPEGENGYGTLTVLDLETTPADGAVLLVREERAAASRYRTAFRPEGGDWTLDGPLGSAAASGFVPHLPDGGTSVGTAALATLADGRVVAAYAEAPASDEKEGRRVRAQVRSAANEWGEPVLLAEGDVATPDVAAAGNRALVAWSELAPAEGLGTADYDGAAWKTNPAVTHPAADVTALERPRVAIEPGGKAAVFATLTRTANPGFSYEVHATSRRAPGEALGPLERVSPDAAAGGSFSLDVDAAAGGGRLAAAYVLQSSDGWGSAISATGTPPVDTPTPTATPTTVPEPTPTPTPQAPPPATPGIEGPATARQGQPVFLRAAAGAGVARYLWDLDGSGAYATDTGAQPWVIATFPRSGGVKVGLRVVDGAGATADTVKDVAVERPTLARVTWEPRQPRPGQTVRFKVAAASDATGKPLYYAWDVDGVEPSQADRTLRFAKPVRRSVTGVPAAPSGVVRSSGAALTKAASYTVKMPKRAGVVGVEVASPLADGGSMTSTVNVAVGRPGGMQSIKTRKPGDVLSASDCAKVFDAPCPSITQLGDAVVGYPSTFQVDLPEVKGRCIPGGNAAIELAFQNLGYPPYLSAQGAVLPGLGLTPVAGGRRTRSAPVATASACENKLPKRYTFRVARWEFGDGTAPVTGSAGPSGTTQLLSHVYAKDGTFTLTVDVEVVPGAVNGGSFDPYVVRLKLPVQVSKRVCQPIAVNAVKFTAESGCFLTVAASGSGALGYRTIEGERLLSGGASFDPGAERAMFLDPKTKTVDAGASASGPYGFLVGFRYGPAAEDLFKASSRGFTIPSPLYYPETGELAVKLPVSLSGTNTFHGLGVNGAALFLPAHQFTRAAAQLSLDLPDAFEAGNGQVIVRPQGGPGGAQRVLPGSPGSPVEGDPVDFEMKIPDASLGLIETRDMTINHRTLAAGGGWFGGGTFMIFEQEMNARYGNELDGDCGEGGLSGFSITEQGDFDFAGATLLLNPDLALGPIGLYCLQAYGKAKPFRIVGKVGMRFPAGLDFLNINACIGLAVLKKLDQLQKFCSFPVYVAAERETWFRAFGDVSLFDTIGLANAHLDLHMGEKNKLVTFGGRMDWPFVIIGIHAGLEGKIRLAPAPGFEVFADASIDIPDACPVCLSLGAELLVSHKGVAACALVAGFEYNWQTEQGGVFGGCDLSDKSVGLRSLPTYRDLLAGAAQAPLGATRATTLRLPGNRYGQSFEATGSGDAPTLVVTGPDEKVYRQGAGVASTDGPVQFLRVGPARTSIATVRGKVAPGEWTVTAADGSAPITGVATRTGQAAAAPKVAVRGDKARPTLSYRFTDAPGRNVRFVEESERTVRELGFVAKGKGKVVAPPRVGPAGKRTVYAVIERNGLPIRRVKVAEYRAPGPPKVFPVSRLSVKPARGALRVSWAPQANISKYSVLVRLGTGEERILTTTKSTLDLPRYAAAGGASVTVTPLSNDGLEPAPRTRTLAPAALTLPARG